jgi:hypothetical protein
VDWYQDVAGRIGQLPGVDGVSGGLVVPWRDGDRWLKPIQFAAQGYTPANGEEHPYARQRVVGPGFFKVVGIPVVAGREFTDADRLGSERIAIVSQSIAQRYFSNGDAVDRQLQQTGTLTDLRVDSTPLRIVGVVADVDDVDVARAPAMTIYYLWRSKDLSDRIFVRTSGDPHALVPAVTRILRSASPDAAVERPATLEEVRAEILSPERLNAFVVSGFAGIALLIAVVGVSGVLAFSVSARMREFGIRLAIGSSPRDLLARVLQDGLRIVVIGIVAGVAGSYAFARIAGTFVEQLRLPGTLPLLAAAAVLVGAGILASWVPAARAARVDALRALRSE